MKKLYAALALLLCAALANAQVIEERTPVPFHITSPSNNQCLVYQASTNSWINAACTGGSGTVTVTGTPVAGQLTLFSGATSIQGYTVSGDCTQALGVFTCLDTNGTPFGSLATASTPLSATLGGTGEAGTLTGPLKGNGTGAFTAASAADIYNLFSGTPSSTCYLSGSGACSVPSGAGSVTSVGLADGSTSAIFNITNTPVTTAGTLTETLKTQTANTVFAGPTTGTAAQPAFRALVSADMPASGAGSGTVTSVTCGTGLTGGTITASGTCALSTPVGAANGGTGVANGSGSTLTLAQASTFTSSTGNIGTLEILQNSQTANYTLVLSDSGKMIYHASGSAHTFTIPANSSVAFPIGTAITFVNRECRRYLTIAITTDTMYFSPGWPDRLAHAHRRSALRRC